MAGQCGKGKVEIDSDELLQRHVHRHLRGQHKRRSQSAR